MLSEEPLRWWETSHKIYLNSNSPFTEVPMVLSVRFNSFAIGQMVKCWTLNITHNWRTFSTLVAVQLATSLLQRYSSSTFYNLYEIMWNTEMLSWVVFVYLCTHFVAFRGLLLQHYINSKTESPIDSLWLLIHRSLTRCTNSSY